MSRLSSEDICEDEKGCDDTIVNEELDHSNDVDVRCIKKEEDLSYFYVHENEAGDTELCFPHEDVNKNENQCVVQEEEEKLDQEDQDQYESQENDELDPILVNKEPCHIPDEESSPRFKDARNTNFEDETSKSTLNSHQVIKEENLYPDIDSTMEGEKNCEQPDKFIVDGAMVETILNGLESKGGSVEKNNPKKFICDFCGLGFPRIGQMRNHRVTHTGEKNFSCDLCKKKFTRKCTLDRHKRAHTGERNFKCPVCEKAFYQKAHMVEHMYIHTGAKDYTCNLCGKAFGKKSHLSSHMLSHTQIKNHVCKICQKGFTMKSGLTKHHVVHTGEKKFKCNLCEKHFSQACVLNKHMFIHTGEKNFKCEVCAKLFSQKGQLMIHMRVHTQEKKYACDTCGDRFAVKSNLDRHMTTHDGDRKFVCTICQRAFKQRAHLKGHMQVHSDHRSFECPLCLNRKFLRQDSFKRHLRESHSDSDQYKSLLEESKQIAAHFLKEVYCKVETEAVSQSESEIIDNAVNTVLKMNNTIPDINVEMVEIKQEDPYNSDIEEDVSL